MNRPVGPQPAIPQALWPELQQLDRQHLQIEKIATWLDTTHGIRVSRATVSRTLAKVRAAAPPPPPPVVLAPAAPPPSPPPLLYATEEDELAALRFEIRKDLQATDWKQRHSAGSLLCKILAESRARRAHPPADPDPGPSAPSVTAPLFTSHMGRA